MKLTGAAILVSRGMKVLQAAPAAYPYRSAAIQGRITAIIFVPAGSIPAPVPLQVDALLKRRRMFR
jgi:hypothetical protein